MGNLTSYAICLGYADIFTFTDTYFKHCMLMNLCNFCRASSKSSLFYANMAHKLYSFFSLDKKHTKKLGGSILDSPVRGGEPFYGNDEGLGEVLPGGHGHTGLFEDGLQNVYGMHLRHVGPLVLVCYWRVSYI